MTDRELDRAIVWLGPGSVRRIRRAIASRRGIVETLLELEPDDGEAVRELLEELDELGAVDRQLAAFLADAG